MEWSKLKSRRFCYKLLPLFGVKTMGDDEEHSYVDPEGKMHAILDFAGESRSVADPWYTGDFEQTYQDLVIGCRALLEHIENTEKHDD